MSVVTYTAKVRKRIPHGWYWQVTENNTDSIYSAIVAGDGWGNPFEDWNWPWRPTRKWAARRANRLAKRFGDQLIDRWGQDAQPSGCICGDPGHAGGVRVNRPLEDELVVVFPFGAYYHLPHRAASRKGPGVAMNQAKCGSTGRFPRLMSLADARRVYRLKGACRRCYGGKLS